MSFYDGKTILITGGTGSFGRMFTSLLLKESNPESVRIFSRGEYLQWEMEQQFDDDRLRFFIGDIRDKDRLYRASTDADIIVHAAALKQVPAAEYNPIEAIKTNIDGASNVIDAAIDNGVQRVMAISTDKAVHPVNLYGATKMVAEKLFVQGNSYAGRRDTRFACTRYGNVVGSRGSIIPLFQKQKEKGTLTITDERMTRFWLTLEQGAEFVMNCIELMKGGEIFVPKIPSMRIIDLAKTIAPDARLEFIGIRPGEKLHEVLITEDESRHSKEFEKYFVIEPELKYWQEISSNGGKKLPEGFRYTSDNNMEWISTDVLQRMINI